MVDLSLSMRVKRGFHRMGIFVAVIIGLGIFTFETYLTLSAVHLQEARYHALRCAAEKLEKQPQITPSGPWDKYKTAPKTELTISSSGEAWPGWAVTGQAGSPLPPQHVWDVTAPDGSEYVVTAPADGLDQAFHSAYGRVDRVDLGKIECGDFPDVPVSEILESRSSEFNYVAAITSRLGLNLLIAALVATATYVVFVAFGWIVSGFMRD